MRGLAGTALVAGAIAFAPSARADGAEADGDAKGGGARPSVLRVDATDGVLQRRCGRLWCDVCELPCESRVRSGTYRVAGSIRPSKPFEVGEGESLSASVDAGSKGQFVLGIVMTSVGFPAALISLLVAAVADGAHDDHTRNVALGVGGFSLGAIAVGVVMIVSNARSDVTLQRSSVGEPRAEPFAPRWSADVAREGVALPPAFLSPVVRLAF